MAWSEAARAAAAEARRRKSKGIAQNKRIETRFGKLKINPRLGSNAVGTPYVMASKAEVRAMWRQQLGSRNTSIADKAWLRKKLAGK